MPAFDWQSLLIFSVPEFLNFNLTCTLTLTAPDRRGGLRIWHEQKGGLMRFLIAAAAYGPGLIRGIAAG